MRRRVSSPGSPPGRPVRVLLVEDSENDAMLLLRELRRGGYEPQIQRVFTPEDMEEALGEAGERGEAFEVVISDYYMPRFRAPEALALLRGLGYDTPFIVVSGKIGEDAAVEIMKAGADDYLTKENMSRLCPAIERELGEAEVRRERERAEEALSRSEDRFRRLVEQIPAVTYVQEPVESDNPKAITYMSPQYLDMFGYPPERGMLDEEHWLGTLHPADRERVLAEELRTDETGEPFRVEYRQIARDGRIVWVRDQATLVRDERGRPLYWLGVQYDITEQKRIEAELRQSEHRYRTFIEQSTEGIWRFELEEPLPLEAAQEEQIEHIYRHTYLAECNDAMARMYGYGSAGELVGARLGELLPRSEPENVEYLRAFMISGYSLTDAESREVDRHGNPKVFLNNLTGIVEDGFLVRAWGTQRDVTERKEAEEALSESEDRFRLLANETAAGIVLVENGAIFDANKSFTRMFGYELGELVGVRATEFVVPEDREEVARRVSSGDTEAYEIRGLKKDGRVFPVEIRPRQLPYKGRSVRLTSVIDLTERKRAEQALHEIREAERNRIARELHDSIMQDIVYALQEIQIAQVASGDGQDPALEDSAEALRRSVEGLRGAIFELRLEDTLGRSFASSLENLIDLNRRMSRRRYETELIVEDGFPSGLSLKTGRELARIVQEALTNVRRHADAGYVRVKLGVEGEVAYVEVSDDGRGFAAGSTKAGIGRHSMHQRALEIGGELLVESEPGGGTRVRCSVPVSRLIQDSEGATHPAQGPRLARSD